MLYSRFSYFISTVLLFCGLLLASPMVLAGTYNFTIERSPEAVGHRLRQSVLVNKSSPAPLLKWQEGEEVIINVTNKLDISTSIHWHGLILPYQMDGVPDISFPGIMPGETFTYKYKVNQAGTYWYHGHSGFQEQEGLLGPIIVEPKEKPPVAADRSYAIVLSDWTDENPTRILEKLKAQPDYYNNHRRTVGDFFQTVQDIGLIEAFKERFTWGQMRMNATDLADVTGYTYTFLINGKSTQEQWSGLFKAGEVVRLHFINASAMTYFDVRIPGLTMQVVQVDGQDIVPVSAAQFRMAVAETFDVIVRPDASKAYAIFAESLDRSGSVQATLTAKPELKPETPKPTPPTYLTAESMMKSHTMAGHEGMDMGSASSMSQESPMDPEQKMTMGDNHAGMMHAASSHASMAMPMQDAPSQNRVLDGYDWITSAQPHDNRKADREIKVRLTGNMARYIWSIDDVVYEEAEPIRLKLGERVRFTYVNETMMNHPMHLHGMWQDLDVGRGPLNPRKHTINVKPGETTSVDVTVDASGEWAFHCHLVYHMATGMFRKVIVE